MPIDINGIIKFASIICKHFLMLIGGKHGLLSKKGEYDQEIPK